jgi:hypothetical protein
VKETGEQRVADLLAHPRMDTLLRAGTAGRGGPHP